MSKNTPLFHNQIHLQDTFFPPYSELFLSQNMLLCDHLNLECSPPVFSGGRNRHVWRLAPGIIGLGEHRKGKPFRAHKASSRGTCWKSQRDTRINGLERVPVNPQPGPVFTSLCLENLSPQQCNLSPAPSIAKIYFDKVFVPTLGNCRQIILYPWPLS